MQVVGKREERERFIPGRGCPAFPVVRLMAIRGSLLSGAKRKKGRLRPHLPWQKGEGRVPVRLGDGSDSPAERKRRGGEEGRSACTATGGKGRTRELTRTAYFKKGSGTQTRILRRGGGGGGEKKLVLLIRSPRKKKGKVSETDKLPP